MNQLNQLLQSIKSQVQDQGLQNTLELRSIFQAYQSNDWEQLLQSELTDKDSYVLHQDQHFKLLLIRWDRFKKSSKHGHPEGGGLIKVLSGTLLETRFDCMDTDKVIGKYRFEAGELSYIHDDLGYHIVENPYLETAISLHVYTPGIYASNIIKPNSDEMISKRNIKSAA